MAQSTGRRSIAEMEPRRIWSLAAVGTLAGAFSGLFGVGGGIVIVPMLIALFGYGERLATGTSLAAIILIAVGYELVIAHPLDELGTAELLTVVAGPIIYLAAQSALRWRMTGSVSRRRLFGIALCVVIGAVGLLGAVAMLVAGLLVAVLVLMAIGDEIAGRLRRQPASVEAA